MNTINATVTPIHDVGKGKAVNHGGADVQQVQDCAVYDTDIRQQHIEQNADDNDQQERDAQRKIFIVFAEQRKPLLPHYIQLYLIT